MITAFFFLAVLLLSGSEKNEDGCLRVTVSDSTGHPVSRARVWICEKDPRNWRLPSSDCDESGPDGRAILQGLRPGFGRYRLAVSAPGYANKVIDTVFISSGDQKLDVRLEAGESIAGRVLSESGKPLAGAMVRLRPPGWTYATSAETTHWFPQTQTGPNGRFLLLRVAAGVHGLLVEGEEGIGWRTGVRAPAEEVEIVVRPGVTITGRAGPQSGAPGEAELRCLDSPFGIRFSVNSDGRFTLRNIPPGEYRALFWPNWKRFDVTHEDLELDLVRPDDRPRRQIQGVVKRQDNSPVPGAIVETVIQYGNEWRGYRGAGWVQADGDGRFALLDLRLPSEAPACKVALLATAGTEVGWLDLPSKGGAHQVTMTIRETGDSLRVNVTDASSGEPLEGARVRVNAEWRVKPMIDTTSALGWTGPFAGFVSRATVPQGGPRPTRHQRVSVYNGHHYFPWRGNVSVQGLKEVSVRLQPRPKFRGRVVDEKRRPLAGLRVLCADGQADTDKNGEFVILGLRQDADFRELRWTGLPRTDPTHFPRLSPHPDQPDCYMIPGARRAELQLRVGVQREGYRIVIGEGHERSHIYPDAHVDQRGVVSLGMQYQGEYRAWARKADEDPWEDLGRFQVKTNSGRTVTVDLTVTNTDLGERTGD